MKSIAGVMCLGVLLLVGSACGPRKPDACSGNPCGRGTCTAVGETPFCSCELGAQLLNGTCIAVADPCLPDPCMGGKRCTVMQNQAQCACAANELEQNGQCVASPCAGVTCGAVPHQTVCTVVGGAPVCTCAPGYRPVGNACSDEPVFDCAKQHSGTGGDAEEPDECPTLAGALVLGVTEQHTLAPANDVDWYSVRVTSGHVLELKVRDLAGSSVIDVFKSDGVTPVAAVHVGSSPVLRMLVPTSGSDPLYVRVAGREASTFGLYEITARDVGTDDHPDTLVLAPSLNNGALFEGDIQFGGDLDVVRVATQAGDTWSFDLSTVDSVDVEIVAADGTVLKRLGSTGLSTTVIAPGTQLYLRARGRTAEAFGSYSVSAETLGADDHGDDAAHATSVTATGVTTNANWERAGDVDVLSFTATQGHVYTLRCASSLGCRATATSATGFVLLTGSSSTAVNGSITPSSSGVVTLQFSAYVTGTAAWTWTLTDTSVDDVGDTNATASPLSAGVSRSAALQTYSDHDMFSFTASANRTYVITCSASVSYICAMAVRDSAGTLMGSVGYGFGSPTTVTVNAQSTATTLYLDVYGSSATGSYSVLVTDSGSDDHGGTAATATPVQLGAVTAGNIQFSGDVDVLSASVTAGTIYSVNCSSSVSYLCVLKVLDANGTVLSSSSYGTSTSASFRATTSGTVTIETRAYYTGYFGAYSVTMSSVTDDYGDTTATAGSVTVGTALTGAIQFQGDIDVLRFSAVRAHVYKVACTGSTSYLCGLNVKDAAGVSVGSAFASSSSTVTISVPADANYTVEIQADASVTGTWTLTITDLGADDFGDTPATAGQGTLGTAISGSIQFANDKDVVAYTTTLNRLYTITCTSSTSYNCSLILRDGAGATVWSNTYSTSVSYGFKAANAGPYTVEVKSYYGYTGNYVLTVTDVGTDDHGDTAATGTTVTVGGAATTGSIQVTGDKDVFVFNGTAGTIYRFGCTTSASYVCSLVARSSAGTSLATAYYGTSTSVAFKAPTAGQYSVEVSASASTGAYSVQLTTLTDDHGDTPGTATALTLGSTKTGNLDYATDVDYFGLSLTAGTTYTITTAPSSVGVAVFDPSLGQVTVSSGTFTALTSGSYSIRISGTSTVLGPYSVLVQ